MSLSDWTPASLLTWLRSAVLLPQPQTGPDFAAPFLIRQEGNTVAVDDLTSLLKTPVRKTGKVDFSDVIDFGRYINEHSQAEATFADYKGKVVISYLDHHKRHLQGVVGAGNEAGWNKHVATFRPLYTRAWSEWRGGEGKWMKPLDWHSFIEDHVAQLVSPNAADLQELALKFEASKKVEFGHRKNLHDGTIEVAYSETLEEGVIKGALKVPKQFTLRMPVYEGEATIDIDCRLGYTFGANGMAWSYKMLTAADVEDAAFEGQLKRLDSEEGITVYHGKWQG